MSDITTELPDASWFRGESIDYVRRMLLNGQARLYEYLDRTAVENLIRQHLDAKENRRLLIWSLLNFDAWCEHFLTVSAEPHGAKTAFHRVAA